MPSPRPLLKPLLALATATALAFGGAGLTSGAAAAPVALPTDAQLKAALLTVDDLGSEFTVVPPDPGAAEEDPPISGCEDLVNLIKDLQQSPPASDTWEAVEFVGPDDNPSISQALMTEDSDQLTTDFNEASAAFDNCTSFTVGEEFGTEFTVKPVTLGDRPEAPAVQLDTTFFGVPFNGYLGLERFGPVGMAYLFFQSGEDSPDAAKKYYNTAVAKVERVLGTQAGSTAAEVGNPG
ncbi:hypothetical protein ACWGB8_16890 [Kitasatospora sp. NPDC054939]